MKEIFSYFICILSIISCAILMLLCGIILSYGTLYVTDWTLKSQLLSNISIEFLGKDNLSTHLSLVPHKPQLFNMYTSIYLISLLIEVWKIVLNISCFRRIFCFVFHFPFQFILTHLRSHTHTCVNKLKSNRCWLTRVSILCSNFISAITILSFSLLVK